MKRSMIFLSLLTGVGATSLPITFSSSGYAQTSGPVNAGENGAEPSVTEEPPPGGCMPIGVTASGEIVFPFLCKGFIEGHKATERKPDAVDESGRKPVAVDDQRSTPSEQHEDANQKPAAVDESGPKPVAADEQRPASDGITGSTQDKSAETSSEEKGSAKQSESVPPETARPTPEPVEAGPPPKAEPDKRRESKRRRERQIGPRGCTQFRSYNPGSGTYTDYSGRRRACRS